MLKVRVYFGSEKIRTSQEIKDHYRAALDAANITAWTEFTAMGRWKGTQEYSTVFEFIVPNYKTAFAVDGLAQETGLEFDQESVLVTAEQVSIIGDAS